MKTQQEIIEINEDNCVVTDIEMDYITKAIEVFLRTDALNHRKFINCKASQIFQKITKLNDLVKQLKESGMLVESKKQKVIFSKKFKEKMGIVDE